MRGTKDKSKRQRFGTTMVYPRRAAPRRAAQAGDSYARPRHHPITQHL
jgi:hypothetical protein